MLNEQVDQFTELCLTWLDRDPKPWLDRGVSRGAFINLIVCVFELPQKEEPTYQCERDCGFISKSIEIIETHNASCVWIAPIMRTRSTIGCTVEQEETKDVESSGDTEFNFLPFLEWWELQYSKDEFERREGNGRNGYDQETEEIFEKAKLEFEAITRRKAWEMKRDANFTEWKRSIRENTDTSQFEKEEDQLVMQIQQAKAVEKAAWTERVLIGKWRIWVEGTSCVSEDTVLWQVCTKMRSSVLWQPFMLAVNLINVLGLMSIDTSCDAGDCDSTYQNDVLPALDMTTNVLFTLDMITSMIVFGFKSYFSNSFNNLDFFVVVKGWLDVLSVGVDVSALRALRVLRPLRLIKYFKGIQSIGGAIYYNLDSLWNVTQFMLFFIVIFGIAGISLFPGKLQHRCIVTAPYPSQTGISIA